MPEDRTNCAKCGASILRTTADGNEGLCMPCRQGRKAKTGFGFHEITPGRHVDWMLINIIKDRETREHADYFFSSSVTDKDPRFKSRSMIVGVNIGLLRISKASGEVELLQAMPEDAENKRFARAATVLRKHWHKAEFPERTVFACG
jgi:hypothetical protein